MKKMLLLLLPILFISCVHTNELAKYNVQGAKIVVFERIEPEASKIKITTVTSVDSKGDKKKKKTSVLEDIAASIGSDLLTMDKRQKLEDAIDTKVLAEKVTDGLTKSLEAYLNVNIVNSLGDGPEYICDVVIKTCEMIVEQNNVSIRLNSVATITDRNTGNIVWENGEYRTNHLNMDFSNKKGNTVEQEILNTVQLMLLDENKLQSAVYASADEIGYRMGDTLREDVIEADKEKRKKK